MTLGPGKGDNDAEKVAGVGIGRGVGKASGSKAHGPEGGTIGASGVMPKGADGAGVAGEDGCDIHVMTVHWGGLARGEIEEIDRESVSPEELAALGNLCVGHRGVLSVSGGCAQRARPKKAREMDKSQSPLDGEGRGNAS
jgi:hypothetical protein